jgi:hypothetical protein
VGERDAAGRSALAHACGLGRLDAADVLLRALRAARLRAAGAGADVDAGFMPGPLVADAPAATTSGEAATSSSSSSSSSSSLGAAVPRRDAASLSDVGLTLAEARALPPAAQAQLRVFLASPAAYCAGAWEAVRAEEARVRAAAARAKAEAEAAAAAAAAQAQAQAQAQQAGPAAALALAALSQLQLQQWQGRGFGAGTAEQAAFALAQARAQAQVMAAGLSSLQAQ